ncbi:hypothetical protein A6F68_02655 [Tsuneonella dongtanensis]|uniref:Competence protein CoiA-like family protein n=1 Tax=Tsuneonella dongtanensis TaxID=692370 RepID=A0A1B2AG75_9SPHN|nr:DUF6035 family protein [Tsuneonella dongtanensis]ANY21149.1 hypothetical protein A6F68_02655 [Tsuneonella dongtanensis]
MAGNTTIAPRAWAEAVAKPEIDEVRSLRSGFVLDVRRLIRAFRYERAILLRQGLKSLVKRGEARLVCATCGVPVYLACSTSKRFFFRHRHENGSCPAVTRTSLTEAEIRAMKYRGTQESDAHKRIKALVLRSLSADHRFTDLLGEQTWRSSEGLAGLRRPDVSARREDLRLAFEVQLSTTFLDVVLCRREFYRTERAALVWVLPNFHPNYRRMTDDDILFANNSNIFVVDESTAEASEATGSFMMKCWHRKPGIDGDSIVDEWVQRLVSWDEIEVDVDLQTVQAFDYSLEAANLAEEIKAAKLARIATERATVEQARIAFEDDLRQQVLSLVLDDCADNDFMNRHDRWLDLNDRLLALNYGLEGKYPDLMKVSRIVHLIETARAGKPVGFNYKNLAEIGHHIFHQHPDLFLAYGFLLRAFGTKDIFDRDDRTGRLAAKIRDERNNFRSDPKYAMGEDEERLCAFLSRGASRSSYMANDNLNSNGKEAA